MESTSLDLLKTLLATPSPSGYEAPKQAIVRQYLSQFATDVETDVHGNVHGVVNPGSPTRVMFAGHCDQIGLVVHYIDDDGFLYVQAIGGWDPMQLVGQRLNVWTKSGAVPGVIARKPIHLLSDEERKQSLKLHQLWLDIGATSREDAESVVRIGDPVTLELGYRSLRNGRASAPAMDNTAGLWVVLEAARRASLGSLDCSLFVVSTVQEEIGLRGARTSSHAIDPHVGVAVDVTHASDCPTIDKKLRGDVVLGGGPVIFRGPNMNPKVFERLVAAAEAGGIPFQLAASGRATPNDANALQVSRSGVATGLVSVPNRYMHSAVEMVELADLDHAADLLARFVTSLPGDTDFTP